MIEITEAVARKVVETVDAGLTHGKGRPIPAGHRPVRAPHGLERC